MKKIIVSIVSLVMLLTVNNVNAQNEKIAVLNFDTRGLLLSPNDLGRMVNLELVKLNKYEVLDKYDMQHLIESKDVVIENCYGKVCASAVGDSLGTQKVLTGTIERFGEKITFSMRLIDVASKSVEKSAVFEFVNLQPHMQKMTQIMVAKLLGLPVDEQLVSELSYMDEPVINKTNKLSASGPRMGIAFITEGTTYDYLEKYDIYPFMTQFGYQHEEQYLSTGNFQALFEFVGVVSGMDQGLFVPTISVMNGFRNTKNGLEFAFGPAFGLKENVDGDIKFSTNFVYAVGKTFRSGHLNIPVNLYVSPDKKEGWYLGASFGFNISKNSH